MGIVSVLIDNIRRGELNHPDLVKGFFRAGNLVGRADNNYADLMAKQPNEKLDQGLFAKAAKAMHQQSIEMHKEEVNYAWMQSTGEYPEHNAREFYIAEEVKTYLGHYLTWLRADASLNMATLLPADLESTDLRDKYRMALKTWLWHKTDLPDPMVMLATQMKAWKAHCQMKDLNPEAKAVFCHQKKMTAEELFYLYLDPSEFADLDLAKHLKKAIEGKTNLNWGAGLMVHENAYNQPKEAGEIRDDFVVAGGKKVNPLTEQLN